MKRIILSMMLLLSSHAWSAPAVLFEEVEVPGVPKESLAPQKRAKSNETEIQPLSQRTSLKKIYESQSFESTDDLRSHRRVGIGASMAGTTGLLGAILELNLTPEESAILGFGGAQEFNAFNFQWKHVFGGQNLSPYAGVGYARWYNASGSEGGIHHTSPAVLGSHFLNEEQKRSGKFTVDLITPTVGIQYNQLNGEYAGMGVFAEVDFLTQVPEFSPVPTGALGILYYF